MFTEHNVSCAQWTCFENNTFFYDAFVFVYFITSSACKLPLFKLAQATEFLPSLSPLCVSVYLVVLLNVCVNLSVCVCAICLSVCVRALTRALYGSTPVCAICVCACVCVGLCPGPSAQQKMMPMEQHGPYRPPSEERLSPGQQSPLMKGSQRVVTLAQHISVSLLVNDMVFILILKNDYILLYYISVAFTMIRMISIQFFSDQSLL